MESILLSRTMLPTGREIESNSIWLEATQKVTALSLLRVGFIAHCGVLLRGRCLTHLHHNSNSRFSGPTSWTGAQTARSSD